MEVCGFSTRFPLKLFKHLKNRLMRIQVVHSSLRMKLLLDVHFDSVWIDYDPEAMVLGIKADTSE